MIIIFLLSVSVQDIKYTFYEVKVSISDKRSRFVTFLHLRIHISFWLFLLKYINILYDFKYTAKRVNSSHTLRTNLISEIGSTEKKNTTHFSIILSFRVL